MNPLKMLIGLAMLAPGLASAKPIEWTGGVDKPVIEKDKKQTVVLKVGIEGWRRSGDRAPLNLALVLDRSGSMAGEKLAQAKEAAKLAIRRLRSSDIVSVVMFDDQVDVIWPAAKVGSGRDILSAIDRIEAGGSTAIHAGVSKGLDEVTRSRNAGQVARVILLSDGLANVGPSSSEELRQLGQQAGRQGVPVTTFGLGLGYNEDLMAALAGASDGNHAFIESERDLTGFFDKEMGDLASVVARDIVIEIKLAPGTQFKKSLDREVEVDGNIVRLRLNQIGGGQERYVLIEVETNGQSENLAETLITYAPAKGGKSEKAQYSVSAKLGSAEVAAKSVNKDVMADAAKARANETRREAMKLRDEGKVEEAKAAMSHAAGVLSIISSQYGISALAPVAAGAQADAAAMAAPEPEWNANRKSLKAKSHAETNQQVY